jgi:hypothetical protein
MQPPQDFSWIARVESPLLIIMFCAVLVRHTYSFLCWVFSIPQNWIVILFRLLVRKR